jgi:hypothetical protein
MAITMHASLSGEVERRPGFRCVEVPLGLETIDRSIVTTANGEMTGRLRYCKDVNRCNRSSVESPMKMVRTPAQKFGNFLLFPRSEHARGRSIAGEGGWLGSFAHTEAGDIFFHVGTLGLRASSQERSRLATISCPGVIGSKCRTAGRIAVRTLPCDRCCRPPAIT